MQCPDCEAVNDVPAGESILLDEVFDDDHPDVDAGVQEHVQLECPDCGAVLGYLGVAGAFGSENTYGYY